MTVITRPVGLGDFQLHHNSDESFGVLWEEEIDGEFVPKDLSDWTAKLVFEADDGTQLDTYDCVCTSDGVTYADIAASDLDGDTYHQHTYGRWRIIGYYENQVELIGAGNFEVV